MRLSNIALYDKTTTDFYNQGLGILSDAISSVSTEEVQDNGNITYEMELKYPIGGVLSDQLKLPNLIRAQESEDPNDFMIFEIYDYDENDSGEMTVYAQAMPYRVLRLPFNDDSKFPTKYNNIQELMDYAVSRVTGFPSWFKITSDIIVANNLSFDAGNAQFENLGKFLDATLSLIDASVEYQWNRINILDSRGRDLSNIVLRDDKNTNGVKITGSYEKIINKVVPIIRNRNEETGEFEEGTHMGSVVTSKDPFKWIPYYAGVTALFDTQEEANNYISSNKLDNPAITVDVTPLMIDEDLTQVHTFDKITAYSTKLKYQDTLQVTSRVFDQLNAEVMSFKMGAIKKDINSTTNYSLSTLASEIAKAQNIASGAARSADGKNTNYYGTLIPIAPIEGDLWFHKVDGKDIMQQYINGEWTTIVGDPNGENVKAYIDQKMLENNQALGDLNTKLQENDQAIGDLHTSLDSNTKTIEKNKADVDAALKSVNETLTQAQTDAETAIKNAGQAVNNAQSAVNASGLATQTANAASDAALAAKNLATSTANDFDKVKSQASTAASDAATALDQAKSALATANGVSDKYNSIKQTVDETSGTIKTLATSASVDAVSGRVTTAQSLAEKTANGLTLKADNSVVNAINGTVKQQGIDLKAAQDQLKLTLTQNDLTNRLNGYATETWAQNKINATADGINATLSTVKTQVQNSAVGTNLLQGTGTASGDVSGGGGTFVEGGFNGYNAVKTNTAWNERFINLKQALGRTNAKVGDWYTISVYVKSDKQIDTGSLCVFRALGTVDANTNDGSLYGIQMQDKPITAQWQQYSWSFQINNISLQRQNTRVEYNQATGDNWIYWAGWKLEKGSLATDWCANPADNATVTALSSLSQTVNGLTGTFATKNDLAATTAQFKVTSDGLNMLTTATGTKGEKVTQVIADVNNIKTTMTGANGYTTRLQTLEGFQSTASSDITNLKTQQTTLAGQWTSIIGTLNSLQVGGTNLLLDSANELSIAGNEEENQMLLGNTYNFSFGNISNIPAKVGDPVTFSADILVTGTSPSGNFHFQFDNTPWAHLNSSIFNISDFTIGTKKRVTFSTKVSSSWLESTNAAVKVMVRMDNVSKTITLAVSKLKLEIGNIPTSWSPAPEDLATVSQITQLQNDINLRVTKKDVINQINVSTEGILIAGSKVHITGQTSIDNAVIRDAMIAGISANKLTAGTIDASKITVTNINAANITSGSIDASKIGVTNINAYNITSGTIDASKIAVIKINADNITSGTIDANRIKAGSLSADTISGGTLNGKNMNIININANSITTGTITGANLAISLVDGDVRFQSGRIHDKSNYVDINIDPSGIGSYVSVANYSNQVLLKGGEMQFVQPGTFDLQTTPYLRISNDGGGSSWAGASFIGRDSATITNNANTTNWLFPFNFGTQTFSGLHTGKDSNGTWNPTIIGGAERGVVISGGSSFTDKTDSIGKSPYIRVGSSNDTGYTGSRIVLVGDYINVPSAYAKTGWGSANVIVADNGALLRTSSASKYKSDITRFRSTEMAEKLIRLPQAHWYNKEEMQRYNDNPEHYPMPELDFGMIAEDIAGAGLEDLVVRGRDGELEDVRYDRMSAVLLPLIATMKQEIATMEQEIEELKGEK